MYLKQVFKALRGIFRTPHEEAVFNNIQFMESVHEVTLLIFFTLNTKSEIEEIEWTNTNPFLQRQKSSTKSSQWDSLEKKVASVFLETFLFTLVSSPLYYLETKLPT